MAQLVSDCCYKPPKGIPDKNLHGICSGCGKHAGFEYESFCPKVKDFKGWKEYTLSSKRFREALDEPDEPEGTIEPSFIPDSDVRRKENLNRTIFRREP